MALATKRTTEATFADVRRLLNLRPKEIAGSGFVADFCRQCQR